MNIQESISSDDSVKEFLDFLDYDIENNPQNIRTIDADLVSYVQSLFENEEIDIHSPIE